MKEASVKKRQTLRVQTRLEAERKAQATRAEELILGVATNTASLYFAYIGDLGNGTCDYDGDYLSNWEELFLTKTNPRVSDTDGDGEDDAREFAFKPNDFKLDCDDDGLLDYDEVGGVRDDCPFLWYDTTNGTNLLSGILTTGCLLSI